MTKLLKYQNQAPRFFWLMSFFPAALGQETIVKKKRFSSFDKRKRFFQPRLKIPALVTFT
jgi:hypothetical protein